MAVEELPGVDSETRAMIEDQVKKGKPRKFFLIYRGATIKTLTVFKKGPYGPKVMRAKKEGFKGDVVCGIVVGSGKNLSFQLAANAAVAEAMQVDTIQEGAPTKEAKLREFLTKNEMKFRPEYCLVADPTAIANPEADADEDEAEPSAAEAEAVAESPPPAADLRQMELETRLKELAPQAIQRVKAGDAQSGLLATLLKTVQTQRAAGDFAGGLETLAQVAAALERPDAERTAEFRQRFTELVPRIKDAADTPIGPEVKQLASRAGSAAKAGDLGEAFVQLDAVERLLSEGPPADAAPAAVPPVEGEALSLDAWHRVRGEILACLKGIAKIIAEAKHAESKKAIIELQAVIKNITAAPDTVQKIDELERYLADDDVVLDVCEFAHDFRLPLVEELARIKRTLV